MSSFNIVTQKKEKDNERERERNIKTITILIAFGLLRVCMFSIKVTVLIV
jgi:hypothetical protein